MLTISMANENPPETGAETDASALRIAITRLARRLRQQRAVADLPDAQYAVLVTLHADGPMALSRLAEREGVSAPSMNRTVGCLEQRGHLTRTADPADRRRVAIAITTSGDEIVRETRRRRDEWLRQALEQLDDEERAILREAAGLMVRMLER